MSSLPFSRLICAKRRSRSPRFDTSPWTPVTLLSISSTAAAVSGLTAPGDEDVGAFLHELLRRREPDAAVATRNECDFSFKLAHVVLLGFQAKALRCLMMNSSSVVGWRPPILLTTSFVPAKTPFW